MAEEKQHNMRYNQYSTCIMCKFWEDRHPSGLSYCTVNDRLTSFNDSCDKFTLFVKILEPGQSLLEHMKEKNDELC